MPIEPPPREKIAVLMPTSSPFMLIRRAAGIARIDRGVGLDEEAEIASRRPGCGQAPRRCRWSPSGRRRRDCRSPARGRRPRRASLSPSGSMPGTRPVDSIFSTARSTRLVLEQHLAGNSRPSASATLISSAPFDDVVVGDDDAVRTDDDAGAERGLLLAPVRHALAEELLEEGIVEERAPLDHAVRIDVDRRAGAVCLTSGAKESCISTCDDGTVLSCASAGPETASTRKIAVASRWPNFIKDSPVIAVTFR